MPGAVSPSRIARLEAAGYIAVEFDGAGHMNPLYFNITDAGRAFVARVQAGDAARSQAA
jgi:DNA-binding PadR family transcriptional regulator